MKYIVYNPRWKDHKRIEQTLEYKPSTWEKYLKKEQGKLKILKMEIKEFMELAENIEDVKVSESELYNGAKHLASASILLMQSIRESADDKL